MEKPNRFTATPEEIADWLRTQFCEDVVLAHQQWIGGLAVEQAAMELEGEAEGVFGTSDYRDFEQWPEAAQHLRANGPFPAVLVCPAHPTMCPGYPKCRVGVES